MIRKLNLSVSGINKIISYSFNGGYDGGSYSATLIVEDIGSYNIGDSISIYFGYDNAVPTRIFTGYIKEIVYSAPDRTYTLTIFDELIKAVDYFVASSTPDNAYKIKNISAEDLVGEVLNMAGITNYGHDTSYFTFGVHGEGEVNLTGAYDFVHGVADLIAWHIYADSSGKVWFKDRKPYVMSTDTSSRTITKFLNINPYSKSDRDLRNRVVIYGQGVYAEAKASSPYLPSGFYKTVVLSSPFIDDQSFAQDACNYNLTKLNRLTEELTISIEGITDLSPLEVITLNFSSPYDFVNGDWFVYNLSTRIGDSSGFVQDVVLRK